MGRTFIARSTLFASLLMAATVAFGCDNGNGGDEDADADVQSDPDAVEDVSPEPDAEAEDLPVDEGVEDLPEEEEQSADFTVVFTDYDGEPIDGVPVAVHHMGGSHEATSDAEGRAVFEGVDVRLGAVDWTYLYGGTIFTTLGFDDPDALPVEVLIGSEPFPALQVVQGAVTRNVSGSWVMVSSVPWAGLSTEDTYAMRVLQGEIDIPFSIFEFTVEGTEATVVGYEFTRFDVPAPGDPGPTVAPASDAVIHTRTVQLDYDISAQSPLNNLKPIVDSHMDNSRTYMGLAMWGMFGPEYYYGTTIGFTTSWTRGTDHDTLEFAWAQAGAEAADRLYTQIVVLGQQYLSCVELYPPADPETWEDTYTIHDVPDFGGLDPSVAITLDQELDISAPGWLGPYTSRWVHIGVATGNVYMDEYRPRWIVNASQDTVSITFTDLPWPSSYEVSTFLPSTETHNMGMAIHAYDEDPYAEARPDEWNYPVNYGGHLTARAYNIAYTLETP